jgi:iron complex transport system substrate-binding protein
MYTIVSATHAVANFVRLLVLFALLCPRSALAEITVTDDLRATVTLAGPAMRVVSLAPHITELLFAAGAGEQIIGVVRHSDFPPAALEIAQIGSYKSISYEALLALQPDLVVAWHSGNGSEIIARLRELGLTVYVNEPRTLPHVARALRDFGQLTGHAEAASSAADSFEARFTALQARYRDRPLVSVFYQVWNQPLTTLNGEHLISDVIRLCGGNNVFADAVVLAPQINVESVIRVDPQVIVASGMGESRPEWLDMWEAWPSIRAVRTHQLYYVPPDLLQRHTPRVLDGAEILCRHLDETRASMSKPAAGVSNLR